MAAAVAITLLAVLAASLLVALLLYDRRFTKLERRYERDLERHEARIDELTNQLLYASGKPWAPPPLPQLPDHNVLVAVPDLDPSPYDEHELV